jgi:hypothetical protein
MTCNSQKINVNEQKFISEFIRHRKKTQKKPWPMKQTLDRLANSKQIINELTFVGIPIGQTNKLQKKMDDELKLIGIAPG